MINKNWMRSIAKSYQQLNEIDQVRLASIEGPGITVKRSLKPSSDDETMKRHLFDTGAYHAQQGLDPHPNGVNDPHYMAGYNSTKKTK